MRDKSFTKITMGITLFLLLRIVNINAPLVDMHNVRQTQTAMITRNLLSDNMNIFLTRVDWRGDSPGYFVQEFPFYSAFVATFWALFGASDTWGRITSIMFGFMALFFLFKIVAKIYVKNVAIWASAFFIICPISIFMSQAFMTNMASLALSLAGLYYFLLWSENRTWGWILLSTILITLAALTNSTVAFIILFPIFYIWLKSFDKTKKYSLGTIILIAIPLITNILWNIHAASINKIYYPEWTAQNLLSHFFSLSRFDRLNPYYYFRIGMYFIYFVAGLHGIFLLGFGIWVTIKRKVSFQARFAKWYLLGAFVYFVIFFNALTGHNYYLLPMVPVVAIMIGVGIDGLITKYKGKKRFKVYALTFVLTYMIWLIFPIAHSYEKDVIAYEAGMAIRQATNKTDLIIVDTLHTNVAPGDMYPTILYYAKRKGWSIQIKAQRDVDLERIDGFVKKGAIYLIVTFGKPERKPISSIFPYFGYFRHDIDVDPNSLLSELKERFKLIIQDKNYAIFGLKQM